MPRLLRFLAAGLLAAALAVPALAQTAKSPFTPEQEARLKEMIREYILANPEVVFEAIQILRKRQEEETANAARGAIKANRDKLQGSKELPIFGNPNGDVTIVEFFDYRCGYCKAVKPTLDEVLKSDGNIRVVMREFPILGPASTRAAMAALAAHKQGKYKEMHEALMSYKDGINDDVIFGIARRIGLNLDKLKADMCLAWGISAVSSSNAITIVKDQILVANACGQQERAAAAEVAILQAKRAGRARDLKGAAAVSDSFFPFADGLDVLARRHVRAIFATSGSINDKEVAAHAAAMGVELFTVPDKDGRIFAGH